MLESVEQRNNLLAQIEKARNSSVIAYFLHDNAVIADDALPHLYDKLQALGRRERIDLLLYARNGLTEVSWRVLALLREYCSRLGVIVGTRIGGAASLLALGADEVVMGSLSEVGGLEGARKHPLAPRDDLGQPVPVSLSEIKMLVTTKDEGRRTNDVEVRDQEAEADTHSLAPLYTHIHPLVIAQLLQADTFSRDVARRALQLHMHSEDSGKVEKLVELFNGGFHSYMYTAARAELKEAGLPVVEPDGELWNAIWALAQLYQAAIYSERPDPTMPGAFFRYVCIIESIGRSTGLRQSFTQRDGQEQVVQVRWETAMRSPGPGPSYGPGGLSNN